MKQIPTLISCCHIIVILFALSSCSEEIERSGFVFDMHTKEPIEGVVVDVYLKHQMKDSLGEKVATDNAGYFHVKEKWAKSQLFMLEKNGYINHTGSFAIANDTIWLEKEIGEPTNPLGNFDIENDLLLVQYDCKTDVDDLHSVAAFATLIAHPQFSNINFHAVAGSYGVQDGLYVPANELFELAFGTNWSDAHNDWDGSVEKVSALAKATLDRSGQVWIAEAGQSDFSAAIVKALRADMTEASTTTDIHIVQHSNWNEEVTGQENLSFVKQNTDYQKIPDGNALDNGTPGFRAPDFGDWKKKMTDPHLIEVWQLATDLANKYNGKDGRYLNEAIQPGGLDFSDFSEVCWIFDLMEIKDAEHFLDLYSK